MQTGKADSSRPTTSRRQVLSGVASVGAASVLTTPILAQGDPGMRVKSIMSHAKYRQAIDYLDRDHDRIVSENIRLTEIPAPPFKEEVKARAFLALLKECGLSESHIDEEGNVLGIRKGHGGPLVAVCAHLDTVFPEGTDVRVKREGTKLHAPGVADDTRGLAVLLAMIRAMDASKLETDSDILFVGSVGEEGLGDLRGVKHLLHKGAFKDRIKSFIAVESGSGGGGRITTTSLGSKRYRLTFTGPGGHSYRAFGSVNPMYALGNFLVEFATIKVPPLTTYGVGVIGGGTSVNSIPVNAWVEIDMRSASIEEVANLEKRMREIATAAAEAENKARSTKNGRVAMNLELIGDRPAGSVVHPLLGARLPANAKIPATVTKNTELAVYAWEAVAAHGLKPELDTSSTDANVPMSLGIPAISLSSGVSDRTHSLDEWLDVSKDVSMRQLGIVFATVLATAGMRLE
jgi:tripeptide aminopeptidase